MSLSVAWLLLAFAASTALFSCSDLCKKPDKRCSGGTCLDLEQGYDRFLAPETEDGDVLVVLVGIRIIGVSNIDRWEQEIDVTMGLQISWWDPGLAVCSCSGDRRRREHRLPGALESLIWVPDLAILNMTDDDYSDGDSSQLGPLLIRHDDTVEVVQDYMVRAVIACEFGADFHPWDVNTCLVRVGSVDLPTGELKLQTHIESENINELNSANDIKYFELTNVEKTYVPFMSFEGREHSAAGFRLKISLPTVITTPLVSLGLAVMANLCYAVPLIGVDRLGSVVTIMVTGLTLLMDASRYQPMPANGFSYQNINLLLSNWILFYTFTTFAYTLHRVTSLPDVKRIAADRLKKTEDERKRLELLDLNEYVFEEKMEEFEKNGYDEDRRLYNEEIKKTNIKTYDRWFGVFGIVLAVVMTVAYIVVGQMKKKELYSE
jgi:hypothetical protein